MVHFLHEVTKVRASQKPGQCRAAATITPVRRMKSIFSSVQFCCSIESCHEINRHSANLATARKVRANLPLCNAPECRWFSNVGCWFWRSRIDGAERGESVNERNYDQLATCWCATPFRLLTLHTRCARRVRHLGSSKQGQLWIMSKTGIGIVILSFHSYSRLDSYKIHKTSRNFEHTKLLFRTHKW